jgi:hypothetical protein
MATKEADSFVVLEGFVGLVGDKERIFRRGDLVHGSDPAVKKWPQFFGAPGFLEQVEQATAAPGEKRAYRAKPEPELEPEPESAPEGKAITLAGLKGEK